MCRQCVQGNPFRPRLFKSLGTRLGIQVNHEVQTFKFLEIGKIIKHNSNVVTSTTVVTHMWHMHNSTCMYICPQLGLVQLCSRFYLLSNSSILIL